MLEALEIDFLGVSLDALLIVAPQSAAGEIIRVIRSTGVNCREIGYVGSRNTGFGARQRRERI